MCRNAYHNRMYGGRNTIIRNTNNILKRNRIILMNLWETQKRELDPADLEALGFDFRFFTQERSDPRGCWRFCYEFAYTINGQDKIQLMQKPNLVGHSNRHVLAAENAGTYLKNSAAKTRS